MMAAWTPLNCRQANPPAALATSNQTKRTASNRTIHAYLLAVLISWSELLTSLEIRWDHFQGLRSDKLVSALLIPAAVKSASLFIRGCALPSVGQVCLIQAHGWQGGPTDTMVLGSFLIGLFGDECRFRIESRDPDIRLV